MTAYTGAPERDLALNAAFDVLNSGNLRVADGAQPTNAGTALGAQISLADCALNATAFSAASGGSKAAGSITQDSAINSTATATWFTLQRSGVAFSGSNLRVMDGSVGTSGQNLNFNSVAFQSGAACSVTALTITQAA